MNKRLFLITIFLLCFCNFVFSNNIPNLIYEFDQPGLVENQWNQIAGGFQGSPSGTIRPTTIISPVIPSSADKKGLMVEVDHNEVAFIYSQQPIETDRPVILRLIFQSDSPDVGIALLAFTGNLHASSVDGTLGLNFPAKAQHFQNDENALVILYNAYPGNQMTPAVQIVGLSEAQTAKITIDRLEIYELDESIDYQGTIFSRHFTESTNIVTPTLGPTAVIPTPTLQPTLPNLTPTPLTTPTPDANQPNIIDTEPNDTIQQAQQIGMVSISTQLVIQGNLNSGGLQNGQYSGDRDVYRFTLTEASDVVVRLNWGGNADVDLYAAFRGQVISEYAGNENPIISQGTLGPGNYELILASKNNATDYTMVIEGKSPSRNIYPNQVSLLSGKYTHIEYFPENNGAIIYSLIFDGQGNYDLWSSVSPYDDELRLESGTYEVAYPFLITNDGSETKIYELVFESERIIYIDGEKYEK